MSLTKKNLFLVFLLVIICVGVFSLFLQAISDIIDQEKFIRAETVLISKKYLSQPAPKKILRDLETDEQDINKISKTSFIGSGGELEFIKFLESAADPKIDREIKLDLDKKIKQDDQIKIPVEIILQSNFRNVIQYLYALEKADYYLEIDSVKINSLGFEAGQESNIKAVISGYVYSF